METFGGHSTQIYTREQVKAVLESCGVDIEAETTTDFSCLCPFHDNTDSPAFTISKSKGLWFCFVPDCDSNGGTLMQLVLALTSRTDQEALRFIMKKGSETKRPLAEELHELFEPERMPLFPQMLIDEFKDNLWSGVDWRGREYLHGRGFNDDTLKHFEAGYDPSKMMVVVPIHDHKGNPIGINGRTIKGKYFKLSKGVPRNKVLFNINRAKRYPTAIFCESQFDVMRLHQAGFPNGVCSMGSHVSKEQMALLNRYFERIVVATDADAAGRKTGNILAGTMRTMRIEWAVQGKGVVYPHSAKDIGDMTDQEIKRVIEGAIPHFEYQSEEWTLPE